MQTQEQKLLFLLECNSVCFISNPLHNAHASCCRSRIHVDYRPKRWRPALAATMVGSLGLLQTHLT